MKKNNSLQCGCVLLGGRTVQYKITYTSKKNIILRVTGIDELSVSMPPHRFFSSALALADRAETEKFILKNEAKVLILLEKYRETKILNDKPRDLKNVYIFGTSYAVKILLSETAPFETNTSPKNIKETVEIIHGDKEITIKTSLGENQEHVSALLKKALKEYFLTFCQNLNDKCSRKFKAAGLNVPVATITVKDMTSRWGSCTASKGRISINLQLVHFPYQCLESVFYHEYSHFIEQNHSKKFYDILAKIYPNYKECDVILKKKKALYSMN